MEVIRQRKLIRTIKNSSKVNVQSCFSSEDFGHIICFKNNLNAELMCDIFKHDLLLTARKQFDLDSTVLELQENNYAKHMWKVALN